MKKSKIMMKKIVLELSLILKQSKKWRKEKDKKQKPEMILFQNIKK